MAALGFNVNVKGIFPNCVKFLSTVLKTPDGFATLTGKHMNETAFSLIAKFQEGRGMKVNAYEQWRKDNIAEGETEMKKIGLLPHSEVHENWGEEKEASDNDSDEQYSLYFHV